MTLLKKLDRKLTDIFKRTGRRDAMLAELYTALQMERYSRLVHELAADLSYLYWDSNEVGQCMAATLDYVEQAEGPSRAMELGKHIIRHVPAGSVFEHVLGCMGRLQAHKDIEDPSRRKTAVLLNTIRIRSSEPGSRVMNTMFCFKEDSARPFRSNDITSLNPRDYIFKLQR